MKLNRVSFLIDFSHTINTGAARWIKKNYDLRCLNVILFHIRNILMRVYTEIHTLQGFMRRVCNKIEHFN